MSKSTSEARCCVCLDHVQRALVGDLRHAIVEIISQRSSFISLGVHDRMWFVFYTRRAVTGLYSIVLRTPYTI